MTILRPEFAKLLLAASIAGLLSGTTVLAQRNASLVPDGFDKKIVYKTVGDVELPLYVYLPKNHAADAKQPAIVFFFGGGWSSGTPAQFEGQCKHLVSRGMVAITVEYRVWSRHKVMIEDCVEDAKSAMRWVRDHAGELGIDPDRIASAGGSAGGHLAACTMLIEDCNAATDDTEVSAQPNAMVLFNPVLGFPSGSKLGRRVRDDLAKVTPVNFAKTKQPPCIVYFGTNDGLLKGAKEFQAVSQEAGNEHKLVTYEGQGHGFFNSYRSEGKYYRETLAATDAFFVELKWLSPSEE